MFHITILVFHSPYTNTWTTYTHSPVSSAPSSISYTLLSLNPYAPSFALHSPFVLHQNIDQYTSFSHIPQPINLAFARTHHNRFPFALHCGRRSRTFFTYISLGFLNETPILATFTSQSSVLVVQYHVAFLLYITRWQQSWCINVYYWCQGNGIGGRKQSNWSCNAANCVT